MRSVMDNLQRVLNTYSPTLGLSNVHVKYIAEQDAISEEDIQRINCHPWSVIEYRGSVPPQALQLDRCVYCGSIAESFPCRGCGAPRV